MNEYGYNDWRNYLMHYNHNHDALGRFTSALGSTFSGMALGYAYPKQKSDYYKIKETKQRLKANKTYKKLSKSRKKGNETKIRKLQLKYDKQKIKADKSYSKSVKYAKKAERFLKKQLAEDVKKVGTYYKYGDNDVYITSKNKISGRILADNIQTYDLTTRDTFNALNKYGNVSEKIKNVKLTQIAEKKKGFDMYYEGPWNGDETRIIRVVQKKRSRDTYETQLIEDDHGVNGKTYTYNKDDIVYAQIKGSDIPGWTDADYKAEVQRIKKG